LKGTNQAKVSIMKNGSFFIPREQIYPFLNPSNMNNAEGLYLCWETDPAVARRVLPPPLELLNPEHPVVMAYVVDAVHDDAPQSSVHAHRSDTSGSADCGNCCTRWWHDVRSEYTHRYGRRGQRYDSAR
jgi:hypothetical protein